MPRDSASFSGRSPRFAKGAARKSERRGENRDAGDDAVFPVEVREAEAADRAGRDREDSDEEREPTAGYAAPDCPVSEMAVRSSPSPLARITSLYQRALDFGMRRWLPYST
jgi:hypothetical protein